MSQGLTNPSTIHEKRFGILGVKFAVFIKVRDKRVKALMKEIARKYKVYKPIRDKKGPHISITYLNSKISEAEAKRLVDHYRTKLKRMRPFYVEINGINSFRKLRSKAINYVVKLRVIPDKNLAKLDRTIKSSIRHMNYPRFNRFQPHVTLAGGDITAQKFYAILREYRNTNIRLRFRLDHVYAGTRRGKKSQWKLARLPLDG